MSDTDEVVIEEEEPIIENDDDSDVDDSSEVDIEVEEPEVKQGSQFVLHHRVPRDERKTSSTMTIFEFARVVSTRALEIDKKGPFFVERGDLTDAEEIARKEVFERRCPLSINRNIGNGRFEQWEVNEMTLPPEIRESYGL